MEYILGILLLVIVFLAAKFYEHYKTNKLFENVKRYVSYNPSSPYDRKPEIRMRDKILTMQHRLSIDERYRITDDESDITLGILHSFQQDLIQKYFNDSLKYCKYTYEEFFTINLMEFLEKHQCKDTFNGNEMRAEVKNYKSYGTWGTTSFSATYVLTDYAITYYKLLYIAQLYYNKEHNISNPNSFAFQVAEGTKKAIDTREIDVNNF